jgi:hypothetical protein
MQMLLQAKLVENHALQQRVSDLEAVLSHQSSSTSVQHNAIKKLQAQIVLLEERYRLNSDRGSTDQLLEHGSFAQRSLSLSTDAESFAVATGGGAALSPGSFSRGGSLASSVPHASDFAAAAAAAAGGAYALETSSSGGSSSTATGAAGGFLSSGRDSSTSPGGASVPWGQHAASLVGLHHHHAAPAHLRAADGGFGLLQQQQSAGGADLAHSPLPPTLSGLSRSLSLSAAAGGSHHQQHQHQQLRGHIGGSAGGMLVGDASSSSDKFVQVCAGVSVAAWLCCCRPAIE